MKLDIEDLEKEMDSLNYEDNKTRNFKFRDNKFNSNAKKAMKKPDHVLVQYLRANRSVDFLLCKVISGNIVVIDNKGHELNPKDTWIRGKYTWYIIREIDTKPVSNRDYEKLKELKRGTENHPVLIKMVLGAIQKKEMSADAKKWIIWIIIGGVVLLLVYFLFLKK